MRMCQGLGGGKKLVHVDRPGGELDVIERVMGGMRWNFFTRKMGKKGRRETSTEGIRVLAFLGGGTKGGDIDRFEVQTQKAKPRGHEDGKGRNDRQLSPLLNKWVDVSAIPRGGHDQKRSRYFGGLAEGLYCFTLGMFSLRCQVLTPEARSSKQVRNKGRGFKTTGIAAPFIPFSS